MAYTRVSANAQLLDGTSPQQSCPILELFPAAPRFLRITRYNVERRLGLSIYYPSTEISHTCHYSAYRTVSQSKGPFKSTLAGC